MWRNAHGSGTSRNTYEAIGEKLDRKASKKKRRRKNAKAVRSSDQVKWSHAIKERDGNACICCGANDGLHAHHILTRKSHPDLSLDMSNGVTLCKPCHRLEHPELPSLLFA